jgi:hypothetical protein
MRIMLLHASGTLLLLLLGWRTTCATGLCTACCRAETGTQSAVPATADNCGPSCRLSPVEQSQRRDTFELAIRPRINEVRETATGYALRFPPDDEVIMELASWVRDERKCCDFLEYQIRVAPNNGPVWLEVAGDEQGKGFIAQALGLSASATSRP